MVCYTTTVRSCPNADPLDLVYGVDQPAAAPTYNGTIVMFAGDGGTYAGPENGAFDTYAAAYLAAGYQIIQVAWGQTYPGYDWEYSNVNSNDYKYNIRNAACRPATFLNWVRNGNSGVGGGIWNQCNGKPNCVNGGMCGHGNSGGAGAMAYALAWYNAGVGAAASNGSGYLDKVVLENGPVFSDIYQGCEVQSGVNYQYTQICPPGSTQPGCNSWPGGGTNVFDYSLEYINPDYKAIEKWSGTPTPACASSSNTATTTASEKALWQQMSIVDFTTTTQQPSFNYPNTGMSAWLCQSVTGVVNGQPVPMNNSAPQGELFYLQFTSASQAANFLSVNGVSACPNAPENVESGVVTVGSETFGPPPAYSQPASQALINDMLGQGTAQSGGSCAALGAARAQQD